jgi:hypothetical protein
MATQLKEHHMTSASADAQPTSAAVNILRHNHEMAAQDALRKIEALEGVLRTMRATVEGDLADEPIADRYLTPDPQTMAEVIEAGATLKALRRAVGVFA